MERLLEILKTSGLSDYAVNERTTISHQAFFIGQKLDQHRVSDVKHIELTVYVDADGKRGTAVKEIFPSESEEEIRKDIEAMKFNASLAMNPYFEIQADNKYYEPLKDFNLLESFKNVVSAVQSINDTETEKINSYEVFVNQNYIHTVNSQGVDVSYNTVDEMIEIVINSIKNDHEVEVYQMIKCGGDQTVENIVAEIKKTFKSANDRSNATAVKKMSDAKVLISGSDLVQFFRFFMMRSNTQMVYRRMSQVKIGDACQNGDDCDLITIDVKKTLPFSSKNRPYTADGVEANDFTLVKDGKYVSYNGDKTSSYYLSVEPNPVNNFVVSGGSKSTYELRSEPYLEIVQFSSFDVDPMTGDFGGEFRLAYLYDGKTVTPVTAGSITCSMYTILDHIHFSKETVQFDSAVVPEVIEIKGVNVAGA